MLLAQSWRRSNKPTRALDFVWTTPAAAGDQWLRWEMGGLLGSPRLRMHRFVTRSGKEADVATLAAECKGGERGVAEDETPRAPVGVDGSVEALAPMGVSPTSSEVAGPVGSAGDAANTLLLTTGATPAAGSRPAKGATTSATAEAVDWTTASHYGRPDWDARLAAIAERATSRTVLGIFFCGPEPMAEAVRRAAARAMCESKVRGLVLAGLLMDGRLDDVDRRTLRGVTATGLDVRFVMHVESF